MTRLFPTLILALWVLSATFGPETARAADNPGRDDAYLLPPATGTRGIVPLEAADVLRPALPGAKVPTDPRDGTTGRDDGQPDPELMAMAERALGKAASPLAGGDDIEITPIEYTDSVRMDIASNGDIYLAVGLNPSGTVFEEYIVVFRSQDGGTSFQLFGSINSAPNNYERLYDIDVVEGTQDRVFVTYMYYNVARGGFDMRIAHEDLSATTATWTVRTVMNTAGVSFLGPDLADDSLAFAGYYLYAVCAGLDGNGDDIFFSRSTDFGDTWSAPYRIAELTSSGNLMYSRPMVEVGSGGLVHVIYTYTERLQSTFDDSVRYLKATSYAGASTNWGSPLILYSTIDGKDTVTRDLVTAPTSNTVAVFVSIWGNQFSPEVIASYTNGDTWSALNLHDLPFTHAVEAKYDAATGRVVAAGMIMDSGPSEMAMITTPISNLGSWTAPVNFAQSGPTFGPSPTVGVDPTRGNRVAVAWNGVGLTDRFACFDAEWRADDGVPNYQPGFPVAIPSELPFGNRTAPAVAQMDADPYGEIVFGDLDGKIHVLSHLGTAQGGWPRDVGAIPAQAPVAIGDLNGDGVNAVVAGTTTGEVYAYDPNGNLLPGFPVDLGTNANTYVSIGTVGGPYPRWILAASGNRMARISYRGQVNYKSGTLNGTYFGAAAIGDVDNDNVVEVVVPYVNATGHGGVHIYNGDLSGGTTNRTFFGETPSDAITLGDLDLDGDLEICYPTSGGLLRVMHHDLTDVAGFPFDNGTASPVTAATFAQILGTSQPELLFASRDFRVHVVYSDGTQQSGFPAATGTGWWVFGSPIATGFQGYTNWLTIGSRDKAIHTFRNIGATSPAGWPRNLGDNFEVTPARADLDNDGRVELIFLGANSLHVVDVGPGLGSHSWTMGGSNAQRTSCYECVDDFATPVPLAGPSQVDFRITSRTPTSGPMSFAATLPGPGVMELSIFDVRGRRVELVTRRSVNAGTHALTFDGRDLARGQYFARLSVQGSGVDMSSVQRFLLID